MEATKKSLTLNETHERVTCTERRRPALRELKAKNFNKPIVISVENGVPSWEQSILLESIIEFLHVSGIKHSYMVIHHGPWRNKFWKVRHKLTPFGSIDYFFREAKRISNSTGKVSAKKIIELFETWFDTEQVPQYNVLLSKSDLVSGEEKNLFCLSYSKKDVGAVISINRFMNLPINDRKTCVRLCTWKDLGNIFGLNSQAQDYFHKDFCLMDQNFEDVESVLKITEGQKAKPNLKKLFCKKCLKYLKDTVKDSVE